MSEMKVCPYCGNEILAVAKKCKFCKQWLPEENVACENNSNDDAPTDINTQNVSTDTGNINKDPYSDLFVAMNKEIQNKKAQKGLMIALCVIALVAVVGLVTMLVTKESGTNSSNKTEQSVTNSNNKTEQSVKTITTNDIAIELAKKWDDVHTSKKAEDFINIYAPQVKYYQQTYTPEMIVKSKRDLFTKTPNFLQMISNFEVTNASDGSIKVHFNKLVQTSPKEDRKNYPSYLVIKKIKGNWLIVEESDDVTDANLAKKKEAVSVGEELVYSIADDGYVSIRDFPDADSDVVGVLATNCDGAKLISNQGTWWKVRIDSVVGYVNSEYVKLSNAPVKISELPKVYYVVLGSYESLDSALIYNYRRPDGMECWIYKCTSKGKTVYRLCDGCFSTLQDAQSAISDWCSSLYGHWFTDAWIWKNVGLGNCVFCPVNYETERAKPPLTPE